MVDFPILCHGTPLVVNRISARGHVPVTSSVAHDRIDLSIAGNFLGGFSTVCGY